MKKWKLFGFALAIITVISLGLASCDFDSDFWNEGTLIIKNDTFALPDSIIRITIRQGSSDGNIIRDDTVTIKSGESKQYGLSSGTYAVKIRTDWLFEYDRTVNMSDGSTITLTYDDNGLH